MYHSFCEIDTYRERKNSVLRQLWLFWVVGWLEENVVPGRIENHLVRVPLVDWILRLGSDSSRKGSKSQDSQTIVSVPAVWP